MIVHAEPRHKRTAGCSPRPGGCRCQSWQERTTEAKMSLMMTVEAECLHPSAVVILHIVCRTRPGLILIRNLSSCKSSVYANALQLPLFFFFAFFCSQIGSCAPSLGLSLANDYIGTPARGKVQQCVSGFSCQRGLCHKRRSTKDHSYSLIIDTLNCLCCLIMALKASPYQQ